MHEEDPLHIETWCREGGSCDPMGTGYVQRASMTVLLSIRFDASILHQPKLKGVDLAMI